MTATKKNRSVRTKTLIEQMMGTKMYPLLPDKDKVQILEYLLQCPISEVEGYTDKKYPSFLYVVSNLLIKGDIIAYMNLLEICQNNENKVILEQNRKL